MNNLFTKLVSAVLCLTLLISMPAITCFAATDTGTGTGGTTDNLPSVEPLSTAYTQEDYINSGVVMKVGSDNMLYQGKKQAIFTSDSGNSFGKPIKYEDTVYIPLAVAAGFAGAELTVQENGAFNITLGDASYLITLLNTRVSAGGGAVELDFMPICNSSDDGIDFYPLIALSDLNKLFPEVSVFYDPMGLIILTEHPVSLDSSSSSDLNYMLELMRSFVFNFLSAEEYYDKINKNTDGFTHPYIFADQEQFDFINDVYEGRITDDTYREWLVDKIEYIDKRYFTLYTTLPDKPAITDDPDDYDFTVKPEQYQYLAFELTNSLDCGISNGKWVTYTDFDYGQFPVIVEGLASQPEGYRGKHWNGGYEWSSGRCDDSRAYADTIQELALAYQITREDKYAILAWEMTESLIKWDHWAQGHFLNCASTASAMGCAYDWLYNVWHEMGYDTNKLAQAIYEKCVFYGYIISLDLATHKYCEYFDEDVVKSDCYGTTEYNRLEINWNAVCTSGLAVGMLSIIGAEDKTGRDKLDTGTAIDFTTTKGHGVILGGKDPITKKAHTHTEGMNILYWLLESNLYSLSYYGLKQYAPDGSFIEGPGYWSYATNNLALMLWAIDSATGNDQGWCDFWGIDQTFYFAVQTEYPSSSNASGYTYWAFHDSSYAAQTTSMFFFAADMLDDDGLAAIRLQQLENGKGLSTYDILGYKENYLSLDTDSTSLSRNYQMLSISGITSRSSWDKGCIFTGLIGGRNNDTAHGQTDSGSFTYASDNYTWFVDLGADNYDVYKYFGNNNYERHTYYRNSAEGANTLCLTSKQDTLRAGQKHTGGYYLMRDLYQSSDNGMVAIQDGTTAFDPYANYAYRGLLFTNDRSTVVIQDQVSFKQAESVYWIAHTEVTRKNITISDDGRVAYLKASSGNRFLRVSIVSPDSTLKFSLKDAGINDYLLDTVHRPGYSEGKGCESEYSREGYTRLVIEAQNTLSFNCAVVIENVDRVFSTETIGYSWDDMMDWDADRVYKENAPVTDKPEPTPPAEESGISMSTISYSGYAASEMMRKNTALGAKMPEFFKALCDVFAALEVYTPESFANKSAIKDGYDNYLKAKAYWDSYIASVNRTAKTCHSITKSITGA